MSILTFKAQAEGSVPAGGASAEMAEIIVTAQKRSERINTVPMSITAETGDQLVVDTSDGRLRERFKLAAEEQSRHISSDLKRAHVTEFNITTAQPFLPQLIDYLRRRAAERSGRGSPVA